MNPVIFFFKTKRIKTKLRSEPTLSGGSFLVMHRDRPGNKPTALVRAVNETGERSDCTFLAPGPRFPRFLPALLQTAAWFLSCPSSQGDRWDLRGFLFGRLRIQSCYDVWALKMPHFREAGFLHLTLSYFEHVFFSIMAMTSVVCIPKPFPGVSTEDGSWLLLEARLSEYAQGVPSCTRSPSRSETSPIPFPMLVLVSPLLQKQPYPGILPPPSSGPDPRTSPSASMAEAYQGCDCLTL